MKAGHQNQHDLGDCNRTRLDNVLTRLVPRQAHRRQDRVAPIHRFLVYYKPYTVVNMEAQAGTCLLIFG